MDLPIDDKEFDYIVTALWKCRNNIGEPQCQKLYDKLKLVKEVRGCKILAALIKEYFVNNMEW